MNDLLTSFLETNLADILAFTNADNTKANMLLIQDLMELTLHKTEF